MQSVRKMRESSILYTIQCTCFCLFNFIISLKLMNDIFYITNMSCIQMVSYTLFSGAWLNSTGFWLSFRKGEKWMK